jgi:hypothetical protein
MAFCEPNVFRRQRFGGEGTGIGLREADEFHRPSSEFGYESGVVFGQSRHHTANPGTKTTPDPVEPTNDMHGQRGQESFSFERFYGW